MKIIDFGQNTYQYEIVFRFDCISADLVREIVRRLHVSSKFFSMVSKEADTNQTLLRQGDGTPQSPLSELKIGLDRIAIWTGWHVPYEKWQKQRAAIITELQLVVEQIPVEMILACISQCAVTIPADKIMRVDQIPELLPVKAFYARGVPEELLEHYNAGLAFGDKSGKEVLTFLVGAGERPGDGKITFEFRWNALDNKIQLEQNVLAHTARADKVLESLNSGIFSLLVRK